MRESSMEDALFIDYDSAREVLTPKRRELIKKMEDKEIESMRNLARKVDRGKNVVFDDLVLLAEKGVIDFKKEKNRKIPVLSHSNIFIKPLKLDKKVLA